MPVCWRKILLLDLDGTLVDPAEGVVGCCRYALARMGCPARRMTTCAGPSARRSAPRSRGCWTAAAIRRSRWITIAGAIPKGDLIAHLMEREGLAPDEVCMVGDRSHDVVAAARNGVPTVGVLWGYDRRDELSVAGARVIIARPSELLD
jgi:phosphoglycolate phosphatase-like HAD superfamily hydrolase